MSQHEYERSQAQALDTYLNSLAEGRPERQPEGLAKEQALWAQALVTLGSSIRPDARFARQLEARLYNAAHSRANEKTPSRGLFGRMGAARGKARFTYALAATVALALLVGVAWVWYQQVQPPFDPGQVAHHPTSTLVQPTRTPLPTEAIVSTSTLAPTKAPPTVTRETPTATPSPLPPSTPLPPLELPRLAEWGQGGVGGGGLGDPLLTTGTLELDTTLPDSPTHMTVYVQRVPEAWTPASAAEMSARLGLKARVYQSLQLAAQQGSDAPQQGPWPGYLVVDGTREVLFEASGIVRYRDRSRSSYTEGRWQEPDSVPPEQEAVRAAEAFLNGAGLLDGDYRVSASGDTVSFYRVLDGTWTLTEPFAQVTVWADGHVGEARIWLLALDEWAQVPLISAQEAWDVFAARQPDDRLWQVPYRRVEMPPWGEWQHANPDLWVRTYQDGQQVHRFGLPRAWFPTADGDTPFIALGDLVLAGDISPLADHILQQHIAEQRSYLHAWGQIQQQGEVQMLVVEGWEPAIESYWLGTIRRQDEGDVLITREDQVLQLPGLPDNLPAGTEVAVLGGVVDETLEWHIIQQVGYAEMPPARITDPQWVVEQADLVYLVLPPDVVPPEPFAEVTYRAVQPVWRFRGHDELGTAFEVYVQAIRDMNVE
jgi:hypothetical protein